MVIESVVRAIRGIIFLSVPTYKSYCLIRLVTNESEDEELPTDLAARIQDISTFWVVLALSMVVEYILDQFLLWVPYYELFKAAYFYFLGQNEFSCALLLYRVFICPPLQEVYVRIQKIIASPFETLGRLKSEVARKANKYAPSGTAL